MRQIGSLYTLLINTSDQETAYWGITADESLRKGPFGPQWRWRSADALLDDWNASRVLLASPHVLQILKNIVHSASEQVMAFFA